MRAIRPALALAAVLGIAVASAASAAGGPNTLTFVDKAGDNVSPSKGQDITGVTFTTTGTGAGKKYVAKNLVVTMALAAPATSDGTTVYDVQATLAGCGSYSMQYSPGANLVESSGYAECGSEPDQTGSTGTLFDFDVAAKGSSLVFTVPLKALPGSVKPGATFTALNAYTDFVDPVTGLFGPAGLFGSDAAVYDTAATDTSYKVG